MKKQSQAFVLVLILAAGTVFAAASAETPSTRETIPDMGAFFEWEDRNPELSDGAREKLRKLKKMAAKDEEDVITRALATVYPGFREALKLLNNEHPARAADRLKPMLQSDDPYLASNARFFLARARMQQENFERAVELLTQVAEEAPPRTSYGGESLFRLAICQRRMMQTQEAQKSISRFLRRYPDAPEWQRARAKDLLVELMTYRDGGLQEANELMRYSRRRLKLQKIDDTTQNRQKRIVDILNKIIEQAKKQQSKGSGQSGSQGGMASGSGSGPPSGNAQPSSPATESGLPGGSSSMGELSRVIRGRKGESWGNMPPKERERALSHIKSNFPERYRELVEQYYKSLQEEGE